MTVPNLPGIVFDAESEILYWVDFAYDSIRMTDLNSGVTTPIIEFPLGPSVNPMGLDRDPTTGRLYWTAAGEGTIRSILPDGTGLMDILTKLNNPRAIALDIGAKKMYWTDLNDGIFRATLDGSEAENLVKDVFSLELALDLTAGTMYWATNIGIARANLDGSDFDPQFVPNYDVRGVAVHVVLRADFDQDDKVALPDHALFQSCLSGPANMTTEECRATDLNEDLRTDLCDFAALQRFFGAQL